MNTLLTIWEHAISVQNYDQTQMRKDMFDCFVKYDDYGKNTKFDWSIVVNTSILGKTDDQIRVHPCTMPVNKKNLNKLPDYLIVYDSKKLT